MPLFPPPISPYDIQLLIDTANATPSGSVEWEGERGLKKMLTGTNATLRNRGLAIVGDIESLAVTSSADTRLVLVRGEGIYEFRQAGSSPAAPGDVPAVAGGVWQMLCYLPRPPHRVMLGNGSMTVFTITHNQNTGTPHVRAFLGVDFPYTETTPVSVVALSATKVQVTLAAPPPTNGVQIIISK